MTIVPRTGPGRRRGLRILWILVLGWMLLAAIPSPASAADAAMLQLFKILRDRGSITPEEYQLLMELATHPELNKPPGPELPTVSSLAPKPAVPTTPAPEAKPETKGEAPAAVPGAPAAAPAAGVATTGPLPVTGGTNLPPITVVKSTTDKEKQKWYEKFNFGGYAQFRVTALLDPEASNLNVPNDPTVNPQQLFLLRRGRIRMSGDVSKHLFVYAQVDFSGSVGGNGQFGVQNRDLYADVFPVDSHDYRFRFGQSKIPYGWVNMQSSQNRAPMERPDAINSAAEGERDLGAFFLWAPEEARKRFKELVSSGLRGSGDYGVVAFGAYNGQGPNRPDLNGTPYWLSRVDYPFKLPSGQFLELGVQGYMGQFVPTVATVTNRSGTRVTPTFNPDGVTDRRVAFSAIWYPQPFGVETEWNVGNGPALTPNFAAITPDSLWGGHIQIDYRILPGHGELLPYARWNFYKGGRKFGTNSPYEDVNEVDLGFEYAPWPEVEFSVQYTYTFKRTNTAIAPYATVENADRVEFQVQWNF
ncbi:MAG: porin [Verrucomicrobiota bacterium]